MACDESRFVSIVTGQVLKGSNTKFIRVTKSTLSEYRMKTLFAKELVTFRDHVSTVEKSSTASSRLTASLWIEK